MPKIKLTKANLIKLGLLLLSVVISGITIYYRSELSKLSAYGYLGIFLLSVLGNSTIIIPAPVVLTAFVGGSIYNPLIVGLITALGATIGELTGYLAGFGGEAMVDENKYYQKISKWMKINGFLTILILAAVPNPLFDLAGIISGATNYSIKKFFLATMIGKSLKFITIALLGLLIS